MKGLRLRCPSTHTVGGRRRNHSHRPRYSEKKWEGGKLTSSPVQSNPPSGIENYVFHFVFDVVAPTDDYLIGSGPVQSYPASSAITQDSDVQALTQSQGLGLITHANSYAQALRGLGLILNSSPVLPSPVSSIDSDARPLTHTKIERIE